MDGASQGRLLGEAGMAELSSAEERLNHEFHVEKRPASRRFFFEMQISSQYRRLTA